MALRATRVGNGPIVDPSTPGWDPEQVGTNINGPSLIRAPDWLPGAPGRYLLYFAHHNGHGIRLAYADSPEGPYRIHGEHTLRLEQTPFSGHIASPDVHVDEANRRLLMYFHGAGGFDPPPRVEQATMLAASADGLRWELVDGRPLGESYFRVFSLGDGGLHAIAKAGRVYRAPAWEGPFEAAPPGAIDLSGRHWAVLVRDGVIHWFYSRWGDAPEQILHATTALPDPPALAWIEDRESLLEPEHDWEGADRPIGISRVGAGTGLHELRDPEVFVDPDSGRTLLLYTVAGESGIAVARLSADHEPG